MIKAIIIDDERHCIDELSDLIGRVAPAITVVGSFQTVDEGIRGIRELRPGLVFLDVAIGDQTGFDLLKRVGTIDFDIVFTTAYDQYAVQAFKFSAIDYLLKPIMTEDLVRAVSKLEQKTTGQELARRLEALLHNVGSGDKRIGVPVASGLVFLQVNDIIRCESSDNYTLLFTVDKQKLVVSRTLKEFETLLVPYRFFRVHHSHLINLRYIKSYNKGKGGTVTLIDNSAIEVSTRRKEEFLKELSLL
ncbi:MAG: response regulator transcription factor [Bacteroidetes bacterium]|nr:response regulator transcription factor [Bacteroidota bacterium]